MSLDPVEIVVRGGHDTGKTSLAQFIKEALRELGYRRVQVVFDSPPSQGKQDFADRLKRNMREREVHIKTELVEEPTP
jgi:phage terminase large subunit